ncbi:transcriptional regulator [Gandjariella thermophila]|uniref:Transcriptional regulator n=1 Tax=Gandjariella thermophila TaxID=1931992 RepID=A0A4D4J3R5_9PSEU|nr:transcriptional regulator [Gandjariella thermophila]
MTESRPTFKRRQLARLLRRLREQARLSIEEAAPLLHFSTAKLSRIERAVNGVDVHAVKSMLDLYGVPGDQWPEIIDMAVRARERGWRHAYGLNDKGYVSMEAEASAVYEYQLGYVPGLLQTEEYARAVIASYRLQRRSRQDVDNQIAVRMRRQARLRDNPPLELQALIDESVLHRPIGGTTLMRTQLAHLVEMSELSNVTLRVLASSTSPHEGLEGSFIVLRFADPKDPDVVFIDHPAGGLHLEKEAQVTACMLTFDHLCSRALGPAESVALLRQVIREL